MILHAITVQNTLDHSASVWVREPESFHDRGPGFYAIVPALSTFTFDLLDLGVPALGVGGRVARESLLSQIQGFPKPARDVEFFYIRDPYFPPKHLSEPPTIETEAGVEVTLDLR